MIRTGACLCRGITYTITADPLSTMLCHCTRCQRQSGSMFSTNLVIAEEAYRQQGTTSVFTDRGDTGQPVYRNFCPQCGSPILTRTPLAPGMVILKAGTLDDASGIIPAAECYTAHAAPWLPALAEAARFAGAPAVPPM